jgi:ABC-2 type transport system ATP-binding protein
MTWTRPASWRTAPHRIVVIVDGRIIVDGTSGELSSEIAGDDVVRWSQDGTRFERSIPDSTAFARDLLRADGGSVTELEVRRASLEDTHLALVRAAEDDSAHYFFRVPRSS